MIICLLSWAGVIGWRRGGYRSLLDCMGVGSAIALVVFAIPHIQDRLIDGWWAHEFRQWLYDHIRAVPTGQGLSEQGKSVAESLYHMLVVGIGALAVWIGIQMILKVFQTVMKEPGESLFSRISGSVIGFSMGSVFAAYVVQCLGLLSWVQGMESLDRQLAHSFFYWFVTNWIAS
ncbi:colicin V production protein [Effusibacillus lacus]|nr:colicin V production protein [Effusibacillus lacus]